MARYITLEAKSIARWEQAPQPVGILVTNPPYGKRIGADDMNALYKTIGTTLKHVFTGYHAWIIGYTDEYFSQIGLAPSQKVELNNGGLDCELREYVLFEGSKRSFRKAGGAIKEERVERRPKRNNTPPTTTGHTAAQDRTVAAPKPDARQRPVREIREQTQRKPPGTAPRTGQQGSRREHTPSAEVVVARQEAKHPCQQRNSAQPHMEGTQEKNTDNTDTQK